MRTPPRILIVDDNPENLDIFHTRLGVHGYEIITATDGEQALAIAKESLPDLTLLDVMMPKMDGHEVCRRLKSDPSLPFMPIIMVTAKTDSKDIVAGLEAGGDEYLTKPVDQTALVARVKSMLRIKAFHDTVQEQATKLQAQAAQLADWNRTLEQKVSEQLAELERVGRLKTFFSPQVVELILSGGAEDPFKTRRREVTVVFLDLRGFTAFSEDAEPEEVMGVLREYYTEMGKLIRTHEGTLQTFAGDGMMVFLNDPLPVPNPAERAIRMALAMRDSAGILASTWRRQGFDLGFGVGIAQGYATLGAVGFEGRWQYGPIGTVANLASRLCDAAKPGQVLVTQRILGAVQGLVEVESVGVLSLKGFHKPVPVFNIVDLKKSEA